MQGHTHSLRDHRGYPLALIAFVCAVLALLSSGSPTRLADTAGLTRHTDDRVEQIEAPAHTAAPMACLGIRSAEDLQEEAVDLSEPAEEDDTEHSALLVLRFDVAPFAGQTGLNASSADRALTPFRLRAFSNRGSPSA